MAIKFRDAELKNAIGQLLRFGVLSASAIGLTGGIVYLWRHGGQVPEYHAFRGEPDRLKQPVLMWQAALRGEGRPLIQIGLLVLIATPIARIVFSIFGYLLEKDYLYAIISAIVLMVIVWNF